MSSNLMEKLAISKAIMDKHSQMGRNHNTSQSFEIEKPDSLGCKFVGGDFL